MIGAPAQRSTPQTRRTPRPASHRNRAWDAPSPFALGLEVWLGRVAMALFAGLVLPLGLGAASFAMVGTIDMIERLFATGVFLVPALTAETAAAFTVNAIRWAAVIVLLGASASRGKAALQGRPVGWVRAAFYPALAWTLASVVTVVDLLGLTALAQSLASIGL